MPRSTGQKLLAHDRKLGVRFVAGADEAGRGSLAGPLVVAGVLLDYGALRGSRVRPLSGLNDSKQVPHDEREALFRAVVACATKISVRMVPVRQIDGVGLHRSNLAALRAVLSELHPPAEACLVDGFRLGQSAPPHRAIVDGDARSAAIAAASIVAKVLRDRVMRRLDALYPRYGFMSHVGYITPAHSEAVRVFGPCDHHRRSFDAACYQGEPGETGAVPVGIAGRHDAASSVAPIREVLALPPAPATAEPSPPLLAGSVETTPAASLPRGDQRIPTDESRSTRLSAA